MKILRYAVVELKHANCHILSTHFTINGAIRAFRRIDDYSRTRSATGSYSRRYFVLDRAENRLYVPDWR